MPLQTFDFDYRRPLSIEHVQYQRVFEPIEGDPEVIEDKPKRRRCKPNILWQGFAEYKRLLKFLDDHKNREKFLFHIEGDGAPIEVRLISAPREGRILAYGGVELIFLEANPMPTDFEDPTAPGITVTSDAAGELTVAISTPSIDNVAVTEYEIEINPPTEVS